MQPLLIAALSGRMLAASAHRAGCDAVVLDLFNDLDTRRYAYQSRAVADGAGEFRISELLRGVTEFYNSCSGIVVGSGFEDKPEILRELSQGRTFYGNSAEIVMLMKQPKRFFALLDSLGIPHPDVSLVPPEQTTGWLVKRIGASGGAHIQWVSDRVNSDENSYFQRYVRGRNMSILFAADGKQARILGVNEQWTVAVNGEPSFCYGGAISHVTLTPDIYRPIEEQLHRLVAASGLIGLNGMDFVVTQDGYFVLEINPRPTATVDLYDSDWPQGLLAVHVRACCGELPQFLPEKQGVRAHAIVYARRPISVSQECRFPEWCSDIPEAGASISLHAPICTVHVSGNSAEEVKQKLKERQAVINHALGERVS